MRTLSKSRLLAFRQCPKRLWLEIHRPELRDDSAAAQSAFAVGNRVGEIARSIYDPRGKGVLVDRDADGIEAALARSLSLLESNQPIFELGFQVEGALAFADVMLPEKKGGRRVWRMVEVKSSTQVKDYHRDDIAIQAFIARAAGVPLSGVALAHIDHRWVYRGDGDYRGLLVEKDLSKEAFARGEEVRQWIAEARKVAGKRCAPEIGTGAHCADPYECGFLGHCQGSEPKAEHPIRCLPGRWSRELHTHVEENQVTELGDAPDHLLNDRQLRVKKVTLSGRSHFDREKAAQALAAHEAPAYFMDFETVMFAVPIWKGTRPYQTIPFQFSVHRFSGAGKLGHKAFLDLSGGDPSESFAAALIAACGKRGPVFVYNAGFETGRINELAERFPRLTEPLRAINERVVDLLPIAREYYYHPCQQGSWSLKKVLPAACPDLDYADLDGVRDGGMAMDAFLEAIAPETDAARKAEIERQLLDYCALDTYALARLWALFSGQTLGD